MSILILLAAPDRVSIPLLPLWTVAAILVAAALGVFRPRTILGPRRLRPGESPRILIAIIAFTLAAWALAELAMGTAHQRILKMHRQPPTAPLSSDEIVVYGTVIDAAALGAMVMMTMSRPQGFKRMGINLPRLPRGLLGGIFALAIVLPLIIYLDALVQMALQWLNKAPQPHDLLEILKSHPARWLKAADIFSAVALAPLAEEMFFRGLVQTALRHLLNRPWPAVILTAAFFALVHRWWTWPQIFFLGICLGYVYERSGNLWMSVAMHAAFNLTSMWLFVHFG